MRKSKYTEELLGPILKESISFAEVIKKLGLKLTGGNYRYIKFRIEFLGLDISHFKGRAWSKGLTEKDHPSIKTTNMKLRRPNKEVFVENSPERSGQRLMRRLLDLKWVYECSVCGLVEWKGKKLTLELDHINGVNHDNRFENLRILCPNCHSLTETYGSKKRGYDIKKG